MSLTPQYWGDPIWKVMYIIAYTTPNEADENRKDMLELFYEILGELLPCPECKDHYKEFINKNPLENISRDNLLSWVNKLHNEVNAKIGSKQVLLENKLAEMNNFNPTIPKEVKPVKPEILRKPIHKPPPARQNAPPPPPPPPPQAGKGKLCYSCIAKQLKHK